MRGAVSLSGTGTRRRGQALVEFALVIPILLLLILNLVNFGMLIYSMIAVANAARTGVQYMVLAGASVGGPQPPSVASRPEAVVRQDASALDQTKLVVLVCTNNNGTSLAGCAIPHAFRPGTDPLCRRRCRCDIHLCTIGWRLEFFEYHPPAGGDEDAPMIRARRDNSRGAALVEFGLVALLFFMLLVVFIDLGMMFLVYNSVANAARAGVRYAIVNGDRGNADPCASPSVTDLRHQDSGPRTTRARVRWSRAMLK